MVLVYDTHWNQQQTSPKINGFIDFILKKGLLNIDFTYVLKFDLCHELGACVEFIAEQQDHSMNIKLTYISRIAVHRLIVMHFSVTTYRKPSILNDEPVCCVSVNVVAGICTLSPGLQCNC
jgi:hypothetical protein